MSTKSTHAPGPFLLEPLTPALKFGTATGVGGFIVGGGIGILRSAHPGLVAIFTGAQFFVLGSSFLYTRDAIILGTFNERSKRADLISSTTAGLISGAAAGIFYGKVNSVIGSLLMGTVGHLGQRYVHSRAGLQPTKRDDRPLLDRLADSKWVPFRSIPNREYEIMLAEKLLKVEAEISIIDEKLLLIRQEGSQGNPNASKR